MYKHVRGPVQVGTPFFIELNTYARKGRRPFQANWEPQDASGTVYNPLSPATAFMGTRNKY